MTKNNLEYICADISSNLSLNKLKEYVKPFRNHKILIAITARPEIKDYLLQNIPLKQMNKDDLYFNSPDNLMGVNFYVVNSQKESVKYWYDNQEKELDEYLKKNS